MAGERERAGAEGLHYGGGHQPPHQSDGGASEVDEKEPGKCVSRAW